MSANIHAAASEVEVWGADFNPAHAANARALADAAGSEAKFSDDSFVDFLARQDAPSFDYIVLHGVWSWVSDDNRRAIVDILRRRLKVAGAAYLSYNTLPGWAVAMPLRHMLTLHAETAGSYAQGMVGRIDSSLAFGGKLHDASARYFAANPSAKARLDAIAGQNRNYVAHEYFNRDWAPMYFSDMHAALAEAKLSYACAAGLMDQLDGINLTADQQALLKEIPYDVLRETVRDFLLNQQFRRDLYTRGARRLGPVERLERLREIRFILTIPADELSLEASGGLGKVSLKPDIYQPVVDELAGGDGGPKRLADLAARPGLKGRSEQTLLEALAVLVGSGQAHTAQADEVQARAAPRCHRLNAALSERARATGEPNFLASPVTGGGVIASRLEQMFLASYGRGRRKPEEWAADAWAELARQGQSIVKEGVTLTGADQNLRELNRQTKAFAEKRFRLFKRLGLVPAAD
jgi:hypothetical protein